MEKPHLRHAVFCLRTETNVTDEDNYLNVLNTVVAQPDLSKDNRETFNCLLVAGLHLPADAIEGGRRKLETGRCFGHYEIVRQIWAG